MTLLLVFVLDSEQKSLLAKMLSPGDPSDGKWEPKGYYEPSADLLYVWNCTLCCVCRITFIAVSDPEDQDTDCEELGAASVDLNMVYMLMMVVVLLHYYCINNCRCWREVWISLAKVLMVSPPWIIFSVHAWFFLFLQWYLQMKNQKLLATSHSLWKH